MFDKYFRLFPISIVLTLILITGAVSTGRVSAQPGPPNHFYGKVMINGAPAPDGVLVEARVFGDYVAGTTTSGGTYGQESPFKVPDPHGTMHGKTIEFYVQNVKAAEHKFDMYEPVVELDLSVTMNLNTDGGNGGNGGNGGIILPPPDEEEEEEGTCTEDWMCTGWTECMNGKRSRTCADLNRCGTTENKPAETEDCLTPAGSCEPGQTMCRGNVLMACSSDGKAWVDLEECEFGCSEEGCVKGFDFTGMFTGLPATVGAVLGLIVIVILGLYFGKIRRK